MGFYLEKTFVFSTATISDYYCSFPELQIESLKQVCLILQGGWSASILILLSIKHSLSCTWGVAGMLESIPAV